MMTIISLEDDINVRDGQTVSPYSVVAECKNLQFLDKQRPKNLSEELSEILQPAPIPQNADPGMVALLAALNQTNALILQQSKRIRA